MHGKNKIVSFNDAPEMEQVSAIIDGWHRVELPKLLKNYVPVSSWESGLELAPRIKAKLAGIPNSGQKSQLEDAGTGWLYDFIRANVKRGRVFDLREVLSQRSADCLGYAKLFTLLGRVCGVGIGVIEVVIDNAGRYVPHTACLAKLADGQLRFVDLWYGSKNINHQRMGLRVKRGRIWRIEDLTLKELSNPEDVSYLPDSGVNAITRYILGNRHLDRKDFTSAIECYSEAIRLYPHNARFYYNRAVTYENLGEHEKAKADYAQALRNDAAVIRILATEHDEVTGLIELDAKGIENKAQEIYLLYKGFTTGEEVPLAEVARGFGLSKTEARAILSSVEAKLGQDI